MRIAQFPQQTPDVQVTPDREPWLTLTQAPLDGPSDISVHSAKQAQRREREATIAEQLPVEGEDLYRQQIIEAALAALVAQSLPADLSLQERLDAAAVAIRLHDPRWQQISRYYAADAILVGLRKDRYRIAAMTDSELRQLADRLAETSHRGRLMAWTGQIVVTAREWTRAALGLMSLTEEL